MPSAVVDIAIIYFMAQTSVESEVVAINMQTRVKQIVGWCQYVFAIDILQRKVFQVCITIGKDVIEHNQREESF